MSQSRGRVFGAVGKAVGIILAVALAALTALTVYIMVCNMRGKAAEVFGVSIMRVVTGSMEPSILEGDYIIVKKADPSALCEGDIICFYSRDSEIYGKPNTHRIVRRLDDGSFVTKGDANRTEDTASVLPEDIIGKYEGKARFFRWLNSFTSLKKLLVLAVIVLMTAAAVYEVRSIARITSENKAQKERLVDEEKQRLMRQAIDREKQKLYEQGYVPESEDNGENGQGG